MKIKPIAFNYGELLKDMPNSEIKIQRKNVVIDNDILGMWGESIDEENQIMLLTSISVKREHTKNSKETLTDLWESHLNQYAVDDQPEEILNRVQEKETKALEAKKKAEENAKKAEAKAAEAKLKAETKTSAAV